MFAARLRLLAAHLALQLENAIFSSMLNNSVNCRGLAAVGKSCAYSARRSPLNMSHFEKRGKLEAGGFGLPVGWKRTFSERLSLLLS